MRGVTTKSLTNAALFYLRRYSASASQLERVLRRKATRAIRLGAKPPDDLDALLRDVLGHMLRAGYVDDARLAQTKTASLRRAGKSARAITSKLRTKGLSAALVTTSLASSETSDADAVWTFARKKRLGPFRTPEARGDKRMKDIAALARAGFSYGLAKQVVDATSADDAQGRR